MPILGVQKDAVERLAIAQALTVNHAVLKIQLIVPRIVRALVVGLVVKKYREPQGIDSPALPIGSKRGLIEVEPGLERLLPLRNGIHPYDLCCYAEGKKDGERH